MNTSTASRSILVFSLLLLIINPPHAGAAAGGGGGGGGGGELPSDVDMFDKAKSYKKWIPALFVFGDSLVDSGNNNFLESKARADYPPYGFTFFPNATGRFTDGRTSADFIAQLNGLPFPPPYLKLKEYGEPVPKTGVNFASGSSGILPETGAEFAINNLNLDKQIELFEEVRKELRNQFKNEGELSQYLSKAVFYISIGSNDFVLGFFDPSTELLKVFTTADNFAKSLYQELESRLKKLYNMGARKFLVNNIAAVGCTPITVNSVKPPTACFNPWNDDVSKFNNALPKALANLQAKLPESKFVVGNIFKLFKDITDSPAKFQITDTRNMCCVDMFRNGTSPCEKNEPPCKDVKSRLFFDMAHPTQTVHYLLVRRCFSDPDICSPLTLSQLLSLDSDNKGNIQSTGQSGEF